MRFPEFHLGGFINNVMGRLDVNHNGRINIAAHQFGDSRTLQLLALADTKWTPFDFCSTRGDGYVTRNELAKAIRDHVDLNHDNQIDPRERYWAAVNFGL